MSTPFPPHGTLLVLGSGGREHAMAKALSASSSRPHVMVAPGNGGIAMDPMILGGCVAVDLQDHDAIIALCLTHQVVLTIVGPELPLCEGVVDRFRREGLAIVGPTQHAAKLEFSKSHAKKIMSAAAIPTAPWRAFDDVDEARVALSAARFPCVIKADGLAAGKGAFVVRSLEQAHQVLDALMVDRIFGDAGAHVIREEFMSGQELSYMVLTDGTHIKALPSSRDYKRLGEGDTGANTGGMGAISPSPDITPELDALIHTRILHPLLGELRARRTPYSGFLYVGLMLTAQGPVVLEFNVRPGDPEMQAVLCGMESDMLPALWALATGGFEHDDSDLSLGSSPAVCVVSASRGYPGEPESGAPIHGLDEVDVEGVMVCYAGVRSREGQLVTQGGRVLSVTARASSMEEARALAYAQSDVIRWEGRVRRGDIGGSLILAEEL